MPSESAALPPSVVIRCQAVQPCIRPMGHDGACVLCRSCDEGLRRALPPQHTTTGVMTWPHGRCLPPEDNGA